MHKRYRALRETHRAMATLFCTLSATCSVAHAMLPVVWLWPRLSVQFFFFFGHVSNLVLSYTSLADCLWVTPSQQEISLRAEKGLTRGIPSSPFQLKLKFENVPICVTIAMHGKGWLNFIELYLLFLSGSVLTSLEWEIRDQIPEHRAVSGQREEQQVPLRIQMKM